MVLPKLSNDDVKEIQQFLKEGRTCKDLAKKYGVSPSVIYRRGKALYLGRFVPLETKNNIIKKIKEGYSKAEAAQMYDGPCEYGPRFHQGVAER